MPIFIGAFAACQVFVVIHVVAFSYYLKALLPPKAYRVAQALVVTIGMWVIRTHCTLCRPSDIPSATPISPCRPFYAGCINRVPMWPSPCSSCCSAAIFHVRTLHLGVVGTQLFSVLISFQPSVPFLPSSSPHVLLMR